MTSRAVIGFLAGIALICAAIAIVPLTADAGPEAISSGGPAPLCQGADPRLDEGYGVSRHARNEACARP